ncbi:MAG: HAMP domain-containing protein [Deltaproteobacteria bacterium]|nr:HAMP domain-containing protein [Deltaproteobacteria bacterium]
MIPETFKVWRFLRQILSSIFAKIFFWFWLGTILSGVTFYILTAVTESSPISEHRQNLLIHRRHLTGQSMALYGEAAIEIFERKGLKALNNYTERMEKTTGIHTYLFPNGLHSLAGQDPSPQVQIMAERSLRSGKVEFGVHRDTFLVAQPMFNAQGLLYIIVGEVPGAPPQPVEPFYKLPAHFGMRMLVTFIIGGLICSWLAWHLTSPIRKLRHATQEFAQGNLATRVRPTLGTRRDEIGVLAREFDQMAEQIEGLMTSQKRLLRDISHELRSPLARLNVAMELLRQKTGPEAESSLERIRREADRLNEMIGQILSLNAIDASVEAGRQQTVALDALLREVVADADFEAKSRHCRVSLTVSEQVRLEGNPELLMRGIENVIRNGVRYGAPGTEVEVGLECAHDGSQAWSVLTVRDHGPGVPEEDLEKIFQPFYRVADARDRQSGGTGIGLAITERAVRLHGGSVKAANHPEGGLVVKIRLPIPPSP